MPSAGNIDRSSIFLAEDSRLNVYAGKLEVRPPGAPTTRHRTPPGPIASPTCSQPLDSRPWRLLRLFFSTLSTAYIRVRNMDPWFNVIAAGSEFSADSVKE